MRGNWPLAGGVALIRSLIPADTRSRIFCSWAEVIRLFATALSRRVLTAAVSALLEAYCRLLLVLGDGGERLAGLELLAQLGVGEAEILGGGVDPAHG